MNETAARLTPAVSLRDVTKVYRLYQKPSYRVLDLLGLLPAGPRYYHEHAALSGINLDVFRGEKVAIIGRNGAGKTTLLKIVTGVVQPTAGTATFHARVSPLLQIGTGFHGDFTGRQNVYASLAHQGITGTTADRRFEEIVEFSELHEYIDQPMKAYSTGMAARLMFSAATAIEPEILVVDELLGVGDAYFAHKSFERMRQMCAASGTTLLLVTHDLYSAMNLCERFIWIDRGRVVMEGDGRSTVAAYENSIKQQEEERLRQRNVSALRSSSAGGAEALMVQVRSRSGFALDAPVALSRIEILHDQAEPTVLPVSEGSPAWTLAADGNLSPPAEVLGERSRSLTPYGSIFHKAEWTVTPPHPPTGFKVRWHYSGSERAEATLSVSGGRVLARVPLTSDVGWQEASIAVQSQAEAAAASAAASGHYGTGRMRIHEVSFTDAAGNPVVRVRHGAPLNMTVRFETRGEPRVDEPTFVVAFHRAGTASSAFVHRNRLTLPPGAQFETQVRIDSLLLGAGLWLVTVGLAEPDFYDRPFHPFFTVNPGWHHMIARGFELQVDSASAIDAAAFFMQPAEVSVQIATRQTTET